MVHDTRILWCNVLVVDMSCVKHARASMADSMLCGSVCALDMRKRTNNCERKERHSFCCRSHWFCPSHVPTLHTADVYVCASIRALIPRSTSKSKAHRHEVIPLTPLSHYQFIPRLPGQACSFGGQARHAD